MGPPSPVRKRSRSRGEYRRRSRSFSPRRQSRGCRGSKSRSPLGKRRKSPPRHRSPGHRRSRSYSPKGKTDRLGSAGRLPRPTPHNQGPPANRGGGRGGGGGMGGLKQQDLRPMDSSHKLARSPARGGSPKPKHHRRSRSMSPRPGGTHGSRMARASSPDSSRKAPDKARCGGSTRASHREGGASTSAAAAATSAASSTCGKPPRGKKDRFDQTDVALNQRFTPKGEEPFVPQENISIGIERNIPGGEQAIILKRIRLEEVIVTRRKDEGVKALHKRPEFQAGKGDHVEERRVIRVVSPLRPSHGDPPRENFEVTRESTGGLARVTLSTGWKGDRRNIESKALGVGSAPGGARKKMTSEELDRFLLNDTSHPLSHGDRDERMVADSIGELSSLSDRLGNRSPPVVSHFGDRDERLVLEKRLGASNRGDDRKGRDEDFRLRELKEQDRYEEDPNDLRHNIRKKRHVRDDPIDARQKLLKKKEHDLRKREEELLHKKALLEKELEDGDDPLPDFSQRPDKYMYEEWKDRPEITPKGSSYYEHDNRDSGWQDNRGDRRGGYRGRGGGYPPREYTPRDNPQREYPPREFPPRDYRHDNQREGDGGGERDMDRGSERGTYRGRRGYRRPFAGGYRGNTRGNYRGSNYQGNNYRANYRGGGYNNPRGAYSRGAYNHRDDRSLEREWKHDKFEELQDEKPSSTT